MTTKGNLTVERLGGLAGFGLPGSALKSIGDVDLADLPEQDAEALEALFRDPPPRNSHSIADDFHYRLTRQTERGEETIEVPSSAVPLAVASVPKDGFA